MHAHRPGPDRLERAGAHVSQVETKTLCSSQLRLEEVPDSYALLDISFFSSPRGLDPGPSKLPLNLAEFHRSPERGRAAKWAKHGDALYLVAVQTGPDVSSADEARLARIVRSIRFRPLVRE